jgi:hypothetical protein
MATNILRDIVKERWYKCAAARLWLKIAGKSTVED